MNLGIFLGWSAVANPKLQSNEFPALGVPLTDAEVSHSVALPLMATICFAQVWGYLANTLGRKITGYLTALCFIVCATLILNTRSVYVLIISRIIGGIAYIPSLFNGPMYVAEIGEPKSFGRLSSTYVISENVGVLLIYAIGGYVSFKFLNFFSLVFAVLFLIAIVFFPESPVFYLRHDRPEEAKLSLQFFRPENDAVYLENEMKRLNETFLLSKKMKWSHLFTKHTMMGVFIALYIQFAVQATGIDYITTYTVQIFRHSQSSVDPYVCTTIGGVVHIVASCLYFVISNSFGRKTIMIVSNLLQCLFLGCLGFYYYNIEQDALVKNPFIHYLPLICMSLYFLTYSAGAGVVPFTIYGEIFSSEVRDTVMSFICIWNALTASLVIELVPNVLLKSIHMSGVFWLFSGSCIVTVLFTLIFIPETKDKPFLTVINDLQKKAFW